MWKYLKSLLFIQLLVRGLIAIQFRQSASKDGRCGTAFNNTYCIDGSCCSKDGICGYSTNTCGNGCQLGYGSCDVIDGSRVIANISVSTNRRCGSDISTQCPPGQCCSSFGFCGNDPAYCGTGCQLGFGACYDQFTAAKAMNMSPPFPLATIPPEATISYTPPFRSSSTSLNRISIVSSSLLVLFGLIVQLWC